MEFPGNKLLRILVEHDPASPEFRKEVQAALQKPEAQNAQNATNAAPSSIDIDIWRDVFVQQPVAWHRFGQSIVLHSIAIALIWTLSASWLRQQKILQPEFDKSSLITYTPQEYLPPLDTGVVKTQKEQKGDPVYARQPILSVPPEADNHTQTIVAPPDIKLNHDVPLPNIVATGAVAPVVPLDATGPSRNRRITPDQQVVAPAPDVQFAADRVVNTAMKTDIIAPPPDLAVSPTGRASMLNVGPSNVVAPAPQLALDEQHTVSTRGKGRVQGGSMAPVAPPPTVASGGSGKPGRLVALGVNPIAATGPVAVPPGNRRGAFSARPNGKLGASGTPELKGSKSGTNSGSGRNGSLPSGLRVGDSNAGDVTEVASLSAKPAPGAQAASAVSDDKVTDVDREVFHGKRFYAMTLNMPNLNSSTGSWVIRFAELNVGQKSGELFAPVPTEKSDPGYPLELRRANVHGQVTLYAVINADGHVHNIRVLNSPDDRLDSYAADALARWKFAPAIRDGKPVALEAVVVIPFRVHRDF